MCKFDYCLKNVLPNCTILNFQKFTKYLLINLDFIIKMIRKKSNLQVHLNNLVQLDHFDLLKYQDFLVEAVLDLVLR